MKDYYNGEDCLNLIRSIINNLEINEFSSFCTGNIIKYLYRYPHKGGAEDLKKAKDYINFLFCGYTTICKYDKIEKLDYVKQLITERYTNYVFNYNQRVLLTLFIDTLIYYGNDSKYFQRFSALYNRLDSIINRKEL